VTLFLAGDGRKGGQNDEYDKGAAAGLKIQKKWFGKLLSGHGMLGGLFRRRF